MFRHPHAFVLSIIVSFICSGAVAVAFSACGTLESDLIQSAGSPSDASASFGGVGARVIHLPTSPFQSLQCVQGPGGIYSHRLNSTRNDIDLDTSNIENEPIYAPADGIARVHEQDPDRNFGRHINIDLGDGTYVVCAHLAQVFVRDGDEVTAGQLIGYEGCTGSCTGDHVHVGLHTGDATLQAQHGESIPVSFAIADAGAPRGWKAISTDEFVCGIRSMGDPQNGLYYTSVLDTALFHPNGTLVKTGGEPNVYLIENQTLRWIENEELFRSHGYSFKDVTIISEDELSCYPLGTNVYMPGFSAAVYDSQRQLWLVRGTQSGEDRYRIRVQEHGLVQVMLSYGLDFSMESPEFVDDNHPYLRLYPVRPGTAKFRDGSIVRERSRSDLYVISDGFAMPVRDWQTYLLMGFGRRDVLFVEDGVLARVQQEIGDCAMRRFCIDRDAVGVCGGGFDGQYNASSFGTVSDTPIVPAPTPAPTPAPAPAPAPAPTTDEQDAPAPEHTPATDSANNDADPPCETEESAIPEVDFCNAQSCIQGSSLLLSDALWLEQNLIGADVYFWGYGDCFGSYPDSALRFHSEDGHYKLDFSDVGHACETQFTLVSTISTDGEPPDRHMANWYWYQYEPMCRAGTPLCNLVDEGVPWEQWWLSVAYDPATGLRVNGNGFTNRSQLF